MAIRGLKHANTAVSRTLRGIGLRAPKGLVPAGTFLLHRAQERTPVDTGNLKYSAYSDTQPRRKFIFQHYVRVVFPADYAIYVHENPDAYHPVGQWKFLESAFNDYRNFLVEIIKRGAATGVRF